MSQARVDVLGSSYKSLFIAAAGISRTRCRYVYSKIGFGIGIGIGGSGCRWFALRIEYSRTNTPPIIMPRNLQDTCFDRVDAAN